MNRRDRKRRIGFRCRLRILRCQRLRGAIMPPNYRFSMTEEAFEFVPAGAAAKSGLLFMCDHASNALPAAYGDLGLDPALLSTHIASDIGAAEVTRTLAAQFGAPAVLARWSRLLIDLNRGEDDPTLVMKLSDGSIVPGNRHADAAEIASRIARFSRALSRADRSGDSESRSGSGADLDAQFHPGLERPRAAMACRRVVGS